MEGAAGMAEDKVARLKPWALPNKALQRRPRSEILINFGMPRAAPLNAGVRLSKAETMREEWNCIAGFLS
jgi:hypothetical protein